VRALDAAEWGEEFLCELQERFNGDLPEECLNSSMLLDCDSMRRHLQCKRYLH
jgi:hypothetical protein